MLYQKCTDNLNFYYCNIIKFNSQTSERRVFFTYLFCFLTFPFSTSFTFYVFFSLISNQFLDPFFFISFSSFISLGHLSFFNLWLAWMSWSLFITNKLQNGWTDRAKIVCGTFQLHDPRDGLLMIKIL